MHQEVEVTEDQVDVRKEVGVQTPREHTQSQGVFMELWPWMPFLVVPVEVLDKTVQVVPVEVRLKLWLLERSLLMGILSQMVGLEEVLQVTMLQPPEVVVPVVQFI